MQLEMEERDLQKMATLSRNDEKLDQLQAELDAINKVAGLNLSTVQSLCNTARYNMDLDITQSYCAAKCFYHGILHRNYRKITTAWPFSYSNSLVKLSLCNTIHLQ